MIEKARVFFSQLVTTVIFIYLMIRMGLNIMDNTNIVNRLDNIGFNFDSFEAVAVGLLLAYLAILSMIFVVWLMRWPKTNYAKKKKKKTAKVKKIDMGIVKDPKRL